jgi:hypothetical protein
LTRREETTVTRNQVETQFTTHSSIPANLSKQHITVPLLLLSRDILAAVARRNTINGILWRLIPMGLRDQLPINSSPFLIRSIIDMNRNFVTKLFANFFEGKTCRFGPEEVNGWDEEDTPDDDEEEVFPAYRIEAYGGGLQ